MKKLIGYILEGVFCGFLFYIYFRTMELGIVGGIAWVVSRILFVNRVAKINDKVPFFAVIIVLWFMAIKYFIPHRSLIGFAIIPVIFTILFIIELRREKNPKAKIVAPPSKYESDLHRYMKKFNRINMVLSVIMLLLVIISFFVIPYAELSEGEIVLHILPQALLLLFIIITMFIGGLMGESEKSKGLMIKIAKICSVFIGGANGINMLYNINENGQKIYIRRWSIQGFYLLLIVIFPFIMFNFSTYNVTIDSLWESLTYVPFLHINIILYFIVYVLSYVPFTIAGFIKEKIINEEYKYVSLKQFFKRNILTSVVFVIIAVGLYSGILFMEDSPQSKLRQQINEQLENFENKQVTIIEEDLTIDFNNNDYAYMQREITDTLGDEAIYKLVTLKEAETDASGEKYITATFAGYGKNDQKVTCFMFRKYLTSSQKHTKGDIELYMIWASDSITKESVKDFH